MSDDPYDHIAELYDLEHAGFDDDLNLYLNLAEMTGDPILEVGCGSGRLLRPLAEAGHRVTGIDRSSSMLDRARQHLAGTNQTVPTHLLRAEMTDAASAPGGPFGLVIVALNGLLHLDAQDEQRAALAAFRRALDPRGQLVVDILNPTPDALRALEGLNFEGTWKQRTNTQVTKFSHRHITYADQIIHSDLWYDLLAADGALRRVATSFKMRYLQRAELELLLEFAGFAEWQIYGGYDLDPFDDASDRLIVTAEVTPSPALTICTNCVPP